MVSSTAGATALSFRSEQIVLAGGERDLGTLTGEHAGIEIDAERAEMKLPDGFVHGRCNSTFLPPQHGAGARQQFARIEGLGQVVVGSDFETNDAIDVLALGR